MATEVGVEEDELVMEYKVRAATLWVRERESSKVVFCFPRAKLP